MRSFLVLILIAAFTSAAHADDCDNAMDQGTMNRCAEDAWHKSDAELNAVYKKLQSRNKEDAQAGKLLVSAERAWVAFRDAECEYGAADNQGGSIFPLIYFGCLDRLTKARANQLKRYLECEESDAACSLPPAEK